MPPAFRVLRLGRVQGILVIRLESAPALPLRKARAENGAQQAVCGSGPSQKGRPAEVNRPQVAAATFSPLEGPELIVLRPFSFCAKALIPNHRSHSNPVQR